MLRAASRVTKCSSRHLGPLGGRSSDPGPVPTLCISFHQIYPIIDGTLYKLREQVRSEGAGETFEQPVADPRCCRNRIVRRVQYGPSLAHSSDIEHRGFRHVGFECCDGCLHDPSAVFEFVSGFETRIAEGMGDGLSLDYTQHPDGFGQRNQRGNEGGRNTLVLDRLSQRRPATRSRPSGGAHDRGLHPVGYESPPHLGAHPGHVAEGSHVAGGAQQVGVEGEPTFLLK